jgi:hypothetical protein
MNSRQKFTYRVLRGTQSFLDAHDILVGAVNTSGARKTLDEAVARVETEFITQDAWRNQGKGETAQFHALRDDLRLNHMRPITTVAKAKFRTEPFFEALRLPEARIDAESLLNAAREMSQAAAPYASTFVGAGLPADFLEKLDSATGVFKQAMNDRTFARSRRVGATRGIPVTLLDGMNAVRLINSLIEPLLKPDVELLQAWRSVIRVGGRTSRRGTAATTAPPTTPPTTPTPTR